MALLASFVSSFLRHEDGELFVEPGDFLEGESAPRSQRADRQQTETEGTGGPERPSEISRYLAGREHIVHNQDEDRIEHPATADAESASTIFVKIGEGLVPRVHDRSGPIVFLGALEFSSLARARPWTEDPVG